MKHARTGLFVIAALALGWLVRGLFVPAMQVPRDSATVDVEPIAPIWTCAMHPQVQLSEPGPCPLCGMDLVPLADTQMTSERRLEVTPEARALMNVKTEAVERRYVEAEVRMVGKLDYDETRLASITSWVSGRLERLFVDFTGVEVQPGDHLVELFSPKLYAAQTELLQAKGRAEVSGSNATLDAVRERLGQLGLSEEQIAGVEARGTASDRMTIESPIGGIVVHKNATQGMYVEEGMHIYTIADLDRLWVKLDAYESDLVWLHYGQSVEFTTSAYPGERFSGTIAFIDPVVDDATRTIKVRVNVDNEDGRLKPNMFVRAIVRTRMAASGAVMDADLAGKWICPMHPEVVSPSTGQCDVCGMNLVTTESKGYVKAEESAEGMPLVIPATAALVTGKRAIVYVEVPGEDTPTFEGRDVVLGPRAGDWYLVTSGLEEGERVVTHGNFKIDSALQIQAKPSMMSPAGGASSGAHDHESMGGDR